MSDLSVTIHNLDDLCAGKTDFNGFVAGEVRLYEENLTSLPAPIRAAAALTVESFKVGASSLVGAGMTAIGPVLSESSDAQATLVLNLLSKLGVPTNGPLSIAEHAALTMAFNGLKTGLDQLNLKITTQAASHA